MKLTALHIKAAKPKDKPYKLTDGKGLYLICHNNGGKYWRLDYSIDKKRKTISIGTYPEISLQEAREKREELRKKVAHNIDPSIKEKAEARTFESITLDYIKSIEHVTKDPDTAKLRPLQLHVFPTIGQLTIEQLNPSHITDLIEIIVNKKQYSTAFKLRALLSSIFTYALSKGYCSHDLTAGIKGRDKIPKYRTRHRASLVDPKSVGQLIKAIYTYPGTFIVREALKLSAHLFLRPGEIRQLKWTDINFDERMIRIYISKTEVDHLVPLSNQVIEILNNVKEVSGNSAYVFPSINNNSKPMSGNTIRSALMTLGYDKSEQTAHGFRSMASTLLNENGFPFDAIEAQLCHSPKDKTRAAYNRSRYLEKRVEMMTWYSDYLDGLRLTY